MMQHEITAQAGANKRRMRVGRGESSGKGKTCGRGNKGCQSRAGGGVRPLTEGGQMPMFRRLPKRGFSNVFFRAHYEIVNVGILNERFADGGTVSVDTLSQSRLVQGPESLVRILGDGALQKKLNVEAHAFSEKAKQAIESAGGTTRLIPVRNQAAAAKAKRGTAKAKRAGQNGKGADGGQPPSTA
jgi:large subunit ribosomal protein L15